MILSNHAQTLFQQRGFGETVILLLDQLGTYEPVPGGAFKISIPRKKAKKAINDINRISKKLIHAIEKTRHCAVVMDLKEDQAITVMINL